MSTQAEQLQALPASFAICVILEVTSLLRLSFLICQVDVSWEYARRFLKAQVCQAINTGEWQKAQSQGTDTLS